MRPDYGIDAPGVIRNLGIAAAACLLAAAAALVGVLPREFTLHPTQTLALQFPLPVSLLWPGLGCLFGALWMYFGSRYGKDAERNRLLDRITWTGDERVLDVGCGRGLILVGAAKRLTSGTATGVDIWQAADLSGNRPNMPLKNAALEGVAQRVAVQTADMRHLPFDDATFDVVVSRAAIHNLYVAADRAAAVREIARVLKPGGRAVIADIRHHREYARIFAENGCPDARLLDAQWVAALWGLFTLGAMRPNTLLARKSG